MRILRMFIRGAARTVLTFFTILIVVNIILGASGYADKILRPVINEEKRAFGQSLAQSIRDPQELERVLKLKEKELEAIYGIDKPWYQRLPKATLRAAQLKFGEARILQSSYGSSKISDIVLERFPRTALMMTTSFIIVALISIPVGVWSATHVGTRLERVLSFFSTVSFSLPAWGVAIVLIMVFAVKLGILPPSGLYSTPPPDGTWLRFLDLLQHAVLPITSIVLVSLGLFIYFVRAITIKIAQEPYVMFARAQGFSESRVRWRYILRPAAPPIVTNYSLGLVESFSGAIITEAVFNWPGMGRLYWEALSGTPDEGIFLALTVLYSALFLLTMLFLEMLNVWLDPRIRLGER